jgi:hypothetical protein
VKFIFLEIDLNNLYFFLYVKNNIFDKILDKFSSIKNSYALGIKLLPKFIFPLF